MAVIKPVGDHYAAFDKEGNVIVIVVPAQTLGWNIFRAGGGFEAWYFGLCAALAHASRCTNFLPPRAHFP